MKYIIFFLILLFTTNGLAQTSLKELKKEAKIDNDGKLKLQNFHKLNSPNATNPVSLSDNSIVGEKSFRFEVNHGECGQEPNWSDCETERERSELYYNWSGGDYETWKKEKWYRFFVFVPKEYNNLAPAVTSIFQWKRFDPSRVLYMFRFHHGGLYFNFNGDTFDPDPYYHLKFDSEMREQWTEVLFNTNWHPDRDKGFVRVWVDGQMKVDYKGIANHPKKGKKFNLRYGIYSSGLDQFRNTFNEKIHKQRVLYFDGVRGDTSCKKLLQDENRCKKLLSQNVKEYLHYFPEQGWSTSKKLNQYDLVSLSEPLKLKIGVDANTEHKHFSRKEINFLMTAKGDDEKCIRDQYFSGLDLLRKDTIFHVRYSRWEVYSVLKEIVKDCLN
jgi:hypothetical protein